MGDPFAAVRGDSFSLGPALALVLCAAAGGCSLGVDWKHHASFRSVGKELALAHIDPDEVVQGAIRANLDYITLSLDTVFVRNLPGLFGRTVAVGLEITGILPGGKAIQTVLDVKEGVGQHAFLSLDNLTVLEPFLYTGRNLTIALHFRAIPRSELRHVQGRIAGAGDKLRKIDPTRTAALEAGVDLFRSLIGGIGSKELSWKYQFTLHPADSVYRDKPELLLTAARHILFIMAPPDASSELRAFRPDKVIQFLRMRGNRLVWRHSGKEYTETPYLVLNITRFKRYPSPDTELRKAAKQVDEAIEQESYERARGLLGALGSAINADPVITAQEKNLERSWKDYREARIAGAAARKSGDREEELRQVERQVRLLSHIRSQFSRILYPFETKDIDFRVSQLALRAELVAKETGIAAQGVQQIALAHKELAAKLAEPPPKPPRLLDPPPLDLAKNPPPPLPSWKRPHQKWWFWTLVSVGVAGAGYATYQLTRPGPAPAAPPNLPIPLPAGLTVAR